MADIINSNDKTEIAIRAIKNFNSATSAQWQLGDVFNAKTMLPTDLATFIYQGLLPKVQETIAKTVKLGNPFAFWRKDAKKVGQLKEEYVFLDSIANGIDLTKDRTLLLREMYAKIATRFWGYGEYSQRSFTLNRNDIYQNFSTLAGLTNYYLNLINNRLSMFNYDDSEIIKAMFIDYFGKNVKGNKHQYREVNESEEFIQATYDYIMSSLLDSTSYYNEAYKTVDNPREDQDAAEQMDAVKYTTRAELKDLMIITTGKTKRLLLDTKIATNFHDEGLDISNHIMAFDNFDRAVKVTDDVTLDEEAVVYFRNAGNKVAEIGDVVKKGDVLLFDVSKVKAFSGKVEKVIKNAGLDTAENFALIVDMNALKYEADTSTIIENPMNNTLFMESNQDMNYFSFKGISPFNNKAMVVQLPEKS